MSAHHQPIGALYSGGLLHMPPWIERPCALQWKDGTRRIELLGPQNLSLKINDDAPYELHSGHLYPNAPATVWRHFDRDIPTPESGGIAADLVFSGAGLARVSKPGDHNPPLGGAVVRLQGALAQPWAKWLAAPQEYPFPKWELELVTTRNSPLEWVVAAGPKLLNDGNVIDADNLLAPWAAGEFRPGGPPPTRFPFDADRTRGPRTALGIGRNGEWILVVVDGRTDIAHSAGLSLIELSRLMRHIGCSCALNLDGGGSSVMAIEGVSTLDQLLPDLAAGIVNIPSDAGNRERIVPVVMTVIA